MLIDLQRERINRGLSLTGLAEELNLAPSVIKRAEAGGHPRARSKKLIADHFGYRVTEVWPIDEAA